MKKLLFSAFLSLSAYFSYAQVPNAGMEFWDNQPILLFWETNSHPLTLPPWEPYIIRKDTDSHSGNYAANFYGNGIFKPYATSTFPVSYRPVNLSLYYKLNFAPCVNDVGHPEKDTVSVSVELLHNGTVVDNGYWESIAETSFYTKLAIPISQNAATFDSCRITILGGKVLGGCGFIPESTQFRVDHLELKYSSQSGCIDSSLICGTCACITLYDPVCGCDGNTYGNSCEAYNAGLTSWSQGTCSPPTGCIDSSQICPTCPCPAIYSPVCGCNGITYSNSCEAEYAGVTSWTQGACGSDICRADFIYSGSTIAPATIQYQNLATGHNIVSWEWTFSDGTISSQQDPVVTYTQLGIYTTCLKITSVDSSGTCVDSICQTIIITDSSGICINPAQVCDTCNCPAIYDPVCGCDGITYDNSCMAQNAGLLSWTPGQCGIITPCEAYFYYWSDTNGYTVNFEYASGWIPNPVNTSQLLLWNFGDGSTSTDLHPVHTYIDTSIHSYFVCLTVTDTLLNCTNTYCDSVYVDRIVYGCYAGFDYVIDSTGVVMVYPDSASGGSSDWIWAIGNDTTSVDPNPTFQLDSNNNYNVCFIVLNPAIQCTDTVCITSQELYAAYLALGYSEISRDVTQVYVYPNPTSENTKINFTTSRSADVEVAVKNILGETLYQFPAARLNSGTHTYSYSTQSLNRGIYLVELKMNGSVSAIRKLIKQ